ncbi:MAG: hypothetical protein KME08_13775, partial [Aphanothece sp. CMT-3BRIN-NPC111]|nr:hypothetical protein [Aphanothece sp. CMT-3BRIN-NPC111]
MRDPEIFYPLSTKLREELKKEYKLASQKLALFPLLLNNCHRNQASYFGARDITKLNFLFGLNLLT